MGDVDPDVVCPNRRRAFSLGDGRTALAICILGSCERPGIPVVKMLSLKQYGCDLASLHTGGGREGEQGRREGSS